MPAASSARAGGYVLAGVTHLLAPAFLVTGVYLVSTLSVGGVLSGLIVLDLAWLLRPRPAPFPGSSVPLTRAEAPHLFALVDRIGAELGAPRTDLIAVSGAVNASFGTFGWRRRRLLEIGYPLWLILSPQERVALLAHEMAHSRNGDARHGLVVGSALHSLSELRTVTRFGWRPGDGISRFIAEGLLAVLGVPVRVLIFLLERLLYRSSQRAEYRADEMQAQVAGSAAALSLLDVLTARAHAAGAFLSSSTVAIGTANLWAALRSHLAEAEAEEPAPAEEDRVDSTHPPTYLRIRHLQDLPHLEPRVTPTTMALIEEELAGTAERVARIVREDAQSALYR